MGVWLMVLGWGMTTVCAIAYVLRQRRNHRRKVEALDKAYRIAIGECRRKVGL